MYMEGTGNRGYSSSASSRSAGSLARAPLALAWIALSACGGPEGSAPRGAESVDPGASAPPTSLALGELEFEGPSRSGEPNLHAVPDGRVLLTWLEPAAEERWALRLAVRSDGAWSEARTIRESNRFFVNWADFPSSVAMEDGTIAVHWLEKVADAPYAYHVMLSLSEDEGRTWSEPVRAHRDPSPTEHGFVSMVPWRGGAALVWLDGRAMAGGGDTGAGPGHAPGDMTVRFTTLSPEGELGAEVLLDGRSCECCGTALVETAEGLVAAYRDRSPEEIRDIALVRGVGETWSAPSLVASDGWRIPGCPVNGPQLSAEGLDLVAAWYTGADEEARVFVAFSSDGGDTFGERTRADAGLPLGRVDVERLADGSAVVIWLEASEERPRVLARRVGPDGRFEAALLIDEVPGSRASGFPRMAPSGEELVLAWTVPGDDGGVRVRSVRAVE